MIKCKHCHYEGLSIPLLRMHMYMAHGLDYKERE